MIGALQTATQGLKSARVSFDRAAGDVVRAGTQAANAYQQAADVTGRRPGPAAVTPGRIGGLAPQPSLETAIVSMTQAEIAYRASATVVRTTADMAETLLDIEV